jgi:hypothetical protein
MADPLHPYSTQPWMKVGCGKRAGFPVQPSCGAWWYGVLEGYNHAQTAGGLWRMKDFTRVLTCTMVLSTC